MPPGVLNVVNGTGITAGRALGLHPQVDVLAFTGSTDVGRHFLRYAADSNLKRVWLELGGKSPNIVFADAPDLATAAEAAAWGICFNSGQMCTAASRLLVEASILEEFTDLVLAKVATWTPFGGFKASGNGRDKSRHAVDKYTELKTTWINLG